MFDDPQYDVIHPGLDRMQPGVEMAAFLSAIDVTRVCPHDRVIVMKAHQRMESYYQACKYRAMTSVVDALDDGHPQYGLEAAAAEIQAALNLTRRATETELSFALELQQRLPRVWDALVTGVIDIRRAKTFAYCTTHLPDAVARLAVDRVIEHAGGWTTGELKARLDRVVVEVDPDDARERYESAVKTRRLVSEPSHNGTANLLGLDLPPHRVAAVTRRVNHLARSLKTKDETRSMDQLRADVYLDLLTGRDRDANTGGGVHLRADLDTLAALSEHAGELAGYGPVIADIARQVVEEQDSAEWSYLITDPATGDPVADGITRRRPTAALRRTVEGRDQTCVFPGCRMPAVDCDIDHNRRWADGGKTTEGNLAPLCRHNHITKDQHGWTYRRLPNGDYQWTSRLGHTYTNSGTPP